MACSNTPSIDSPLIVPATNQQLQSSTKHVVYASIQQHRAPHSTVGLTAIVGERKEEHIDAMRASGTFEEVNAVVRKQRQEGQNDGEVQVEYWIRTRYQLIKHRTSNLEAGLHRCCCIYACTCCEDPILDSQYMRRARSLGVKGIITSIKNIYTNTPIGSTVRDFCVWGLFLSLLFFFLKSFVLLIKDEFYEIHSSIDYFKLYGSIFSGVGLLFSFCDVFIHTYHRRFKTCKEWIEWRGNNVNNESSKCLRCLCCKRKDRNPVNEEHNNDSCFRCLCMCRKRNAYDLMEESISAPEPSDPTNCRRNRSKCCPKWITTAFDVVRVFLSEMIYYPTLLLSIFELCTQLVINNNDLGMISVLTWLGCVFAFLSMLGLVYIARAFILAGTVYSAAKIRDKKNKCEGATFQIMFVLYSCGLMVLQMYMIVAIGSVYYNDYYEKYKEATTSRNNSNGLFGNLSTSPSDPMVDINYNLSGQMRYIIVCGYGTPILGMMMFFVVHHYWAVNQYPIEVILDVFKSLKSSPKEAFIFLKEGENYAVTLGKVSDFLNEKQLIKDHRVIKNVNCFDKFIYPFKRPLHIFLCFLYTAMLIGFFSCCVSTGAEHNVNRPWFGRWDYYYVFVVVFGFIVNWYVFLVVAVWIVILCIVLLIIAIILLLLYLKAVSRHRYVYWCD